MTLGYFGRSTRALRGCHGRVSNQPVPEKIFENSNLQAPHGLLLGVLHGGPHVERHGGVNGKDGSLSCPEGM